MQKDHDHELIVTSYFVSFVYSTQLNHQHFLQQMTNPSIQKFLTSRLGQDVQLAFSKQYRVSKTNLALVMSFVDFILCHTVCQQQGNVQSVMSVSLKFVFSYCFGLAVRLISGRNFGLIFLSQFQSSLDISVILTTDFVL